MAAPEAAPKAEVEAPSGSRQALTRRDFLAAGASLATGAAFIPLVGRLPASATGSHHAEPAPEAQPPPPGYPPAAAAHASPHGHNATVGDIDLERGLNPSAFLTSFDRGKVSRLPNGRTLREFQIVAYDRTIEIAPGVSFPAWTFNGTVPAPTLRVREGDRVRVKLINAGLHPHNLHFHGIHIATMDGVPGLGAGQVPRGQSTVYEFDAEPFGLHLYHCHALPLKKHLHKGLYGVFIIEPAQGRPPARELVMVMNAFDTNFDGENEVYAVNSVAFHYMRHPIPVKRNELVRIYLANFTEFDPINSFHIHANFFHVYPTGTSLQPAEFTDTIMLAQGQRAILELRFPYNGRYMVHAHVSEFTELGWMGFFEVTDDGL